MTYIRAWIRDTLPKTTLPKRLFAERILCRMRHFAEILPKFGKNAEKNQILWSEWMCNILVMKISSNTKMSFFLNV